MNTNFDEQIRAELVARRGDWIAISAKAGVSHSWISQFCRNKIPNPGIGTLRSVARALDNRGASPAQRGG